MDGFASVQPKIAGALSGLGKHFGFFQIPDRLQIGFEDALLPQPHFQHQQSLIRAASG